MGNYNATGESNGDLSQIIKIPTLAILAFVISYFKVFIPQFHLWCGLFDLLHLREKAKVHALLSGKCCLTMM